MHHSGQNLLRLYCKILICCTLITMAMAGRLWRNLKPIVKRCSVLGHLISSQTRTGSQLLIY